MRDAKEGIVIVTEKDGPEIERRTRALIELYQSDVRPLIEAHPVTSLAALDQGLLETQQALARSARLSVGFVGSSQVGKSSIINALLGQRVVPFGGVGPLTAQATNISYRDVNALEVRYHDVERLKRVAFRVHMYLSKRGELSAPSDIAALPEDRSFEAGIDVQLTTDDGSGAKPSAAAEVGEHLLSQVQLILQRPRDPLDTARAIRALPRTALLDAVRSLVSHRFLSPDSEQQLAPFRDRLREAASYLGRNEQLEEQDAKRSEFTAELRARSAGWLSPLVAKLQVHLRQPLLKDLSLVDLPGVGNVADAGAEVARDFLQTAGAGCLVLVFRNNGITVDVVDILERAGVFGKLLWSGRQARSPIRIVIAVTQLDLVADARRKEIRDSGDSPPSPEEMFRILADEMCEKLAADLRRALGASKAFQDLSGHIAEREAVVRRIVGESMHVMCVDAKSYLDVIERDPRAFLTDEAATNIPHLRTVLRSFGETSERDRLEAIAIAARGFFALQQDALRMLASVYEKGGDGTAHARAARFREDLGRAAAPLKEDLDRGRVLARKTLREDLPQNIRIVCEQARKNGLKKLTAIRRSAEGLYWPSLNAALRYGGTWEGKRLDYPGALTRAIVDTIAAGWEPTIVDAVKGCVTDLAKAEVKLVSALTDAALRIDGDLVVTGQVEAQRRILQEESKSCIRWTSERLNELADAVSKELLAVVKKPIADACDECIADGNNRGPGATKRILDTFETSGTAALEKAAAQAQKVLARFYDKLLEELNKGYLRDHHDPISEVVNSLSGEELMRAKKADEAERKRVTNRVGAIVRQLADVSPPAEGSSLS